jgi:3-oxo-5alpha-steroid 4-dehydrogenase
VPPEWDVEADVVVVGFGAAGACAALEAAAAGCSVLILERFGGGGATALSGGVVYAGGGTPQQRAAGVTDTPEAMLGYLRTEVGDAVPDATLREFCDGSVAMLAWLEGHGVPFEGSLCPDKTSYPTNRHYLYYSGSELSTAAPGSGQVLRPDGRPVDGLYAAGRTAAGLCSRSYVSGLSLADCVFSGRRAGHHAATVPTNAVPSDAQPSEATRP